MTIEEAREYWCRRLERAEGYSDEHWDAEERHAHTDYVDAMKHAVAALAICREREESAKKPKTNGDCIRQMTDKELVRVLSGQCSCCEHQYENCGTDFSLCDRGVLEWLKQEVSEDVRSKADRR